MDEDSGDDGKGMGVLVMFRYSVPSDSITADSAEEEQGIEGTDEVNLVGFEDGYRDMVEF